MMQRCWFTVKKHGQDYVCKRFRLRGRAAPGSNYRVGMTFGDDSTGQLSGRADDRPSLLQHGGQTNSPELHIMISEGVGLMLCVVVILRGQNAGGLRLGSNDVFAHGKQ